MSRESVLPAAVLGGGYSSDRQMPANYVCLKEGEITYSGNAEIVLTFNQSTTFSQMQSILIIGGGSHLNIDIFGGSTSFNYIHSVEDTTFSHSVNYITQISLPQKIWNPTNIALDALSPFGLAVHNAGLTEFREICGDQYIQQEQLGASLVATFNLNFASSDDMIKFTENMNGQFAHIASFTESVEKLSNQLNTQGSLEFTAIQVGGEVEKLTTIFNTANGQNTVTCPLTQATDCDGIVQAVTTYAANDFSFQVGVQNGNVTGFPATYNYTYVDYSTLLIPTDPTSIVTPAIEQARTNLYQAYQNMSTAQTLFSHELEYNTDPINKIHIEEQLANANHNLGLLLNQNQEQGAIGCYFYPEQCVQIAQNILGQFEPITEQI